MTLGRTSSAKVWLALAALVVALAPARTQEDFGFMPKGGKTLLLELTASNPGELREIGAARHNEAEWRELISARAKALSPRDANELSAYLAINMPLPEGALGPTPSAGDAEKALPADGRELAWYQCQSCHSLYTGYLMQDRDAQGWRSIFLSPFHRGIKMTTRERETFARYSAFSMPMKSENVPADLRY